MRHFFKTILLVFGVLIITFSCQKNDEIIEQQNTYDVPSIEAARLYFNEHSNLGQLGTNQHFRTTNNSLITDWDNSKEKTYKEEPQENLDILYTPLYLPTAGHAKSFIGTVEINEEMQSKIFVILYTESDNRLAFSGVMLVYGLDGNIEYGYKYIEGQQVASGLPSIAASNLNRTGSDDCDFPLESMDCLLAWIGGDWFGLNGFIQDDTIVLLDSGDSSTGGQSIDGDLGIPSMSIPTLGEDTSTGGNPWWNDNTVSADGLAIVLALELEHLAMPEAQWLLNEASQEQLQNIADFLNDNRVKDNDTLDEFADDSIDQNQMTEISQEAINLAIQMINFMIENSGTTFEYDQSNQINTNSPSFNTFSEFEDSYSGMNSNIESSFSSQLLGDGTMKRDEFDFNFNAWIFSFTINFDVVKVLPEGTSCDCIEINEVVTYLSGNETLVSWSEIGQYWTEISEENNTITVKIKGKRKVGIKLDVYPWKVSDIITLYVIYDYSTGDVLGLNLIED